MGKRNHYAPEFLLRQFIDGDGGLWQMTKATGECERRNSANAGMFRGLYPDVLEDGYLQQIDGQAATILQASVYGRDTITLTDDERERLSEWFGTLVHRNPKKLIEAEDFVARALADPKSVIDPEIDYGVEYVKAFQQEHPDVWQQELERIKTEESLQAAIAEYGAEEVLRYVVTRVVNDDIREGKISQGDENAKDIFARLINPVRSGHWAGWVLKFHWSWWRTDQEFVIGDDPVCCWSPRLKHVEYGLGHPDCEVTFPVSRKVCLLMGQTLGDSSTVNLCDRFKTAMYNNRQWLATSRFLYGSQNSIGREQERWRARRGAVEYATATRGR